MSIYYDNVKYSITVVSKNNLFYCMYFMCSLTMIWSLIRSNLIIFLANQFFQFFLNLLSKKLMKISFSYYWLFLLRFKFDISEKMNTSF